MTQHGWLIEDEIGEMPIMVSTPLYGHSPLYSLVRERFIHNDASVGCTWSSPIQICEVCGCLHRSWFLYVCYSCSDALQNVYHQSEHTAWLFSEKAIVPNNYDEFVQDMMHRIANTLDIPTHHVLRPIPASTQDEPTARPKPRGPEKRGKWWDRRRQRY